MNPTRLEALRLASACGGDSRTQVERAEMFVRFLEASGAAAGGIEVQEYTRPAHGSADGLGLPLREKAIIMHKLENGFPVVTMSVRLEYAPGHPSAIEGRETPLLDPSLKGIRAAIVEYLGDNCGLRG